MITFEIWESVLFLFNSSQCYTIMYALLMAPNLWGEKGLVISDTPTISVVWKCCRMKTRCDRAEQFNYQSTSTEISACVQSLQSLSIAQY